MRNEHNSFGNIETCPPTPAEPRISEGSMFNLDSGSVVRSLNWTFRLKKQASIQGSPTNVRLSHTHTGKCIRRFVGIYAYCRYFIDRKW